MPDRWPSAGYDPLDIIQWIIQFWILSSTARSSEALERESTHDERLRYLHRNLHRELQIGMAVGV